MKNLLFLAICLSLFSCKDTKQVNKSDTLSQNIENNVLLDMDYEDLLTLEIASKITGFEPSKARKSNPLKGMYSEVLKYSWENGREFVKEKSESNRKRVAYPRTDFVQISFVDFESDMETFLDFVDPEAHTEISKITGVGEAAFWNSKNNSIEVYHNNVSFRGKVEISNDDVVNKEKTIELAKLIIKEKL
jgi:hypothetical protein